MALTPSSLAEEAYGDRTPVNFLDAKKRTQIVQANFTVTSDLPSLTTDHTKRLDALEKLYVIPLMRYRYHTWVELAAEDAIGVDFEPLSDQCQAECDAFDTLLSMYGDEVPLTQEQFDACANVIYQYGIAEKTSAKEVLPGLLTFIIMLHITRSHLNTTFTRHGRPHIQILSADIKDDTDLEVHTNNANLFYEATVELGKLYGADFREKWG